MGAVEVVGQGLNRVDARIRDFSLGDLGDGEVGYSAVAAEIRPLPLALGKSAANEIEDVFCLLHGFLRVRTREA